MHPMTKGRELALQFLYMQDLMKGDAAPFDGFLQEFGPKDLTKDGIVLAKALVNNVLDMRNELDADIQSVSENWKVERMPVIDRNIIRMSMIEMMLGKTPTNVVINEAVELAKNFGSDRAPQFVNGVLDKIKEHPSYKKGPVAQR